MTPSWLHAAATGLWLTVSAPQAPTDDAAQSQTAQAEGQQPWAPIAVACLGVVVGAWLARRQIQAWKQRGG